MLVLSRYTNQTINIGDDIQVKVLGVRGGQVRIGVIAPKTTPVNREEIHEQMIANENKPISLAGRRTEQTHG